MQYRLLIFDLDGTLLNTLEDLATAADFALSRAGFPTRSREEVRHFIGNGVARLIQRAVPEGTPDAACQAVLSDYRRYYSSHVNVHTHPYPGIPELLVALRQAGMRIAVNSNKPDAATQALCQAHFPGLIDLAQGEREGIPKKPDPAGAIGLMQALDAVPEQTLYIGDGETDLMTAMNAGMDGAWVSWGYRDRSELCGLEIPRAFEIGRAHV